MFVTDAVERQNTKKNIMKEYCLTHSYEAKPASTRNSLGFIVVDDENKIIYCTIPKVSTTTWKTVLLNLCGLKRNKVRICTVSKETVVLLRWASETQNIGLSPELIT